MTNDDREVLARTGQQPHRPQALRGLLDDVIAQCERRFAAPASAVTGISDLDLWLAPLTAGRALRLVADRASAAATLALQIGLRAMRLGHPLLVATTLPPAVVAQRLVALAAGVSGRDLLHGRLSDRAWTRIGNALVHLNERNVQIVDNVGLATLAAAADSTHTTSERIPVVIADRDRTASAADPDEADLTSTIIGSPAAWIITAMCPHTTGEADAGRCCGWATGSDLAVDNVVSLLHRDHGAVADIDSSYGWTARVELHEQSDGLGYSARANDLARPSDDELTAGSSTVAES